MFRNINRSWRRQGIDPLMSLFLRSIELNLKIVEVFLKRVSLCLRIAGSIIMYAVTKNRSNNTKGEAKI
ncbi:hypothetical protein CA598_12230 [Paenibacillus sp. VTT E-133291]|nr:hypothetical protein CA598_12230 [Paenibacillus sp. VTT E-133291]